MPQDLYQWEAGGGLVHHCPKCFKPLTTPQARTRCLGEHVEWCSRYHTQLFKKGSSSQCMPCRHSEEQHERRHREIAELVHKLAMLNATTTVTTTDALDTPCTLGASFNGAEESAIPKTKKERKAAKKAKKIAEMPKAVNAATIEHVARVLHPNAYMMDDEELERQLLNDAEIKENRFFHKGTSNIRELRNQFVRRGKKGGKVAFRVEAEEMDGLLQLLDVFPVTASTSAEERKIIDELKLKIEKDLIQAQEDNEGFMMRKAGFWRWASKKAYNRLVANGRIWDDKGDGPLAANSDESGESAEGDAVFSATSGDATDDTNITEPDTDGVAELVESAAALAVSTPKAAKSKPAGPDEGWTPVSKSKGSGKAKKAAPKMMIKLSTNGGLAKMVQSSTPRKTGFLRHHSEDEGGR